VYLLKDKVLYNSYNSHIEISNSIENYLKDDTIIVCIGTDKCIGDCLGPLVGTILMDRHFELPVYGTIKNPIHALNINNKLLEIKKKHPKSFVIGIDACLGDPNSIGEIHIRDYPINPGKGVGKTLPQVGDISIVGIVDSNEHSDFFTSRSIRLNFVMEMASAISYSIIDVYNKYKNKVRS
jgi:putative sporulation protein YyaC